MLNLLEAMIDVYPEVLAENFFVVKGITDKSLDLFFYRSIKVFQWVWDYFLFLMLEAVFYRFDKLDFLSFNPFWLITDVFGQIIELGNDLGFKIFYGLNWFILHEVLINILYELLQTFFGYHSNLERETKLDFPFKYFQKLFSDLVNLFLNITLRLLLILFEHFADDFVDIFSELFIHLSLRFFQLIAELLFVIVINFLLNLVAAHVWKKNLLLWKIYVLVLLDSMPQVLHV